MSKVHLQWLVGAVLALVLIGGAFLYIQRPSSVAAKAVNKLGDAKTANFAANLVLENAQATQQVLGEQGTVEIKLDGAFARSEGKRDALAATMELTTKTESVSVNVEGDMRFLDDKAYLYVKKSPPIFGLLTQLKGQWLEFPRGEASEEAATTSNEPIFTSVKRSGSETINGQRVVKYDAVVNDTAVTQMMDGIAHLLGTRLTNDQIEDLRESVQKVGTVPVELWVKQWSSDLKQLRATVDVPGGNKVRFTLLLHDLNQNVDITAPDNALPINDAVAAAVAKASPRPNQ